MPLFRLHDGYSDNPADNGGELSYDDNGTAREPGEPAVDPDIDLAVELTADGATDGAR